MEFCLICKENVEKLYRVDVTNTETNTVLSGFVCRFCYNKFMDSYYNQGFFRLSKMLGWMNHKRHPIRKF